MAYLLSGEKRFADTFWFEKKKMRQSNHIKKYFEVILGWLLCLMLGVDDDDDDDDDGMCDSSFSSAFT